MDMNWLPDAWADPHTAVLAGMGEVQEMLLRLASARLAALREWSDQPRNEQRRTEVYMAELYHTATILMNVTRTERELAGG